MEIRKEKRLGVLWRAFCKNSRGRIDHTTALTKLGIGETSLHAMRLPDCAGGDQLGQIPVNFVADFHDHACSIEESSCFKPFHAREAW